MESGSTRGGRKVTKSYREDSNSEGEAEEENKGKIFKTKENAKEKRKSEFGGGEGRWAGARRDRRGGQQPPGSTFSSCLISLSFAVVHCSLFIVLLHCS